MTSIDDLFNKPGQAAKRKLEVSHDPSSYYKSAKTSTNGDAKGRTHTTVEDEPEVEDDDLEAGPALPPDDEDGEEYGPSDGEDEDGRFFGGGIGSDQAAALDYLEERERETKFVEEVYDIKWVRSLGVKFEKTINKNQELRSKFENDPQKFMASEADLDDQVKDISILSEHPELYIEFATQGCVDSLVGLLAHENTDIAIGAIEAISELIDEDAEASEEQWSAITNAALEADLLGLLTSNFTRLDETQEADREGVNKAFSILESLASNAAVSATIGNDSKLLTYMLERIKKEESMISQNKLYVAEIISILAQTSAPNRIALANADAVNTLLELVAPYRHRDPKSDTEEEEFIENIFDALTSLVDSSEGKAKFLDAEGVELILIMLREGKLAKSRALRVLDHAVGGLSGTEICLKLVEKQGLKTIFGMFLKKSNDNATTEHLVSIFAGLLRTLPGDSAERIRLLAKFMEKDYEKLVKLMEIRDRYLKKLSVVEDQISRERIDAAEDELGEREAEWFSRRLEAGAFVLQTVTTSIAWLVVEDRGAKRKVVELLAERDEGLAEIKGSLQEQLDGVTDDDEEAQNFKEMLSTLIELVP